MQELELSLAFLKAGYRDGTFSPIDVVRTCFQRIRERGDDHVWTELVAEEAVVRAAEDLMRRPGAGELPLYGIPFSVKDNVDVGGMRTTCGCAGLDRLPARSAMSVQRALAAGALLIGKNTLDQFATGLNGTRTIGGHCRNVMDERYVPGGSSSGSGVAVAAGLVAFSLGTDTGGSGRVPAAMNNVVGVKPTLGLVSSSGLVYNNRFFDCVPVFASSVEDGYAVLEVIRGMDPEDAFSLSDADDIALSAELPARFRFALPRRDQLRFFGDVLAEAAFAQAVDDIRAIGGVSVEIDFDLFIEAGKLPFDSGLLAERSLSYGEIVQSRPDTVHPAVAAMIRKGQTYSGIETMRAIYRMMAMRAEARRLLREVAFLVTPTVGRAYTCDELYRDPIALNNNIGFYTYPISPLDLCALALPASIRRDGLPFGVSLVSTARRDGVLHAAGKRFQAHVGLQPGAKARRRQSATVAPGIAA